MVSNVTFVLGFDCFKRVLHWPWSHAQKFHIMLQTRLMGWLQRL